MQTNISLKTYNSFGIDVKTKYLAKIQDVKDIYPLLKDFTTTKKMILGGGNNVLFLKDFDGIILLNQIKGKKNIHEDANGISLKIMGGENWHELVMWAVDHNYGGIENLALIPGNVGTAPIQNIGAYGSEIKDVILKVFALDMKTGKEIIFDNKDCQFGYRQSIFKKAENKNRYFITAVSIKLSKNNYTPNIGYGAIQQILKNKKITLPNIKQVAEAVIEIRENKLPDPNKIGNAGSFFKNPIVDKGLFDQLVLQFPNMPFYKITSNQYKIPAGWLIEKSGFKGKRFGAVGVHDKQALVLVNYGNASGKQIQELSKTIIHKIKDQFNIELEPEVNFV